MTKVRLVQPPATSFLVQQAGPGDHLDCFQVTLERPVDLPAFLFAFYTSPLFRMERFVLSAKLRRWIGVAEAQALAGGAKDYAIWQVLDRDPGQILLGDTLWGTRSWLSVVPDGDGTVLRFGSRVPAKNGVLHPLARASLPLHVIYARGLLRSAARRLDKRQSA